MSPLASGLGSQFGLIKEVAYGTQLAPTKFFEIDSGALTLDQNYQDGVGLKANRMFMPAGRMRRDDASGARNGRDGRPDEGLRIDPRPHARPRSDRRAAGRDAGVAATRLIGTSMPTKAPRCRSTSRPRRPPTSPRPIPGAVLTGASFSMSADGLLKVTLTWDAMDERTLTTTPAGLALAAASYPTGVTSWMGVGTGAGPTVVTLNAVAVAVCRSLTIDWTQPYKTDRWFVGSGGLKKQPIPNGLQALTGNMELEWFDATAYALFRSGAKVALSFDFVNDLISGAFNEQIKFALDNIQIRGGSPGIDGPDVLNVTVPYVAGDDGVDPPLTVTYMSTDTAI